MFPLQLQLYVLTVIRVTLRRIQKPFRRKSTFCKFKYTILSILRVQIKSVLQALYSDCSEWAIHWSIVLAKIDLVALYFRLIWYHSILRRSIDQKHAKANESWRQNSEIHPAFACSCWPPWFPHLSRPYGACVKRGSGKHMFGLSLFRSSWQSDISTSSEERFIPSPGRTRSVKCPTPEPTKTIKSPPHALPSPPPRAGMTLLGALEETNERIKNIDKSGFKSLSVEPRDYDLFCLNRTWIPDFNR